MIKKLLVSIFFLYLALSSYTPVNAADEACGGEALCPALPGECINGGPWPIGQLITMDHEYCHCSRSNASCTVNGLACNVYPTDDPYAPTDDSCVCEEPNVPFCDVTWWTWCCSPGEPTTGTPTPDGGDPTSTPTGTTSYISGSIQLDESANSSGAFCAQEVPSALNFAGWQVSLTNPSNPSTIYPVSVQNNQFSVNTAASGGSYTLTLDLSGQVGTNYVCSCPAPPDPNNPYLCQYTGVGSPSGGANFYLKDHNLSNDSWFQVFGGNYFGQSGITSQVPYSFCALDASCQAALGVPVVASSNPTSSGFAITRGSQTEIVSSGSSGYAHSYLHLDTRTTNRNAYAADTELGQLSYSYFHKLTEEQLQVVGDGTTLQPQLADWTNTAWWQSGEVNYVQVHGDLAINETQGFALTSGQQLVVLVDGNLTLDDSNPADTNRKITSVAQGGFLAFVVQGDILITADVGYQLDPLAPSVPSVNISNSNLEGVFLADNDLILQSKVATGETLPDRKFIGAGTFVGWHNVLLNRTFEDGNQGAILNNNQAIENFIYRPDLLFNWPTKLKVSTSNWREVDPQFIEQ